MRRYAVLAVAIAIATAIADLARADVAEGINAIDRSDYVTALREFRKAAEVGDAEAQFRLGYMYQIGSGVPVDDDQAVSWYSKAAELGHAEAQAYLGGMYADGFAVPQNLAEAAKWYKKSAEQGFALGQLSIGVAYANGQGIGQDHTLAYMWIQLAATQFEDEWVQQQGVKLRSAMSRQFTAAQIAEAKRLASEWQPRKQNAAED